MNTEELTLRDHGNGVFVLTLNRPERLNALGVETVKGIREYVNEATNRQARVLLISGTGKAFSAGADLKERKGMDLSEKLAHNAGIRQAIEALADAKFVTIAVLNGLAMGGGLELAMACDLRLAAEGVQIGLTESRIGAFPGAGGSQRLPRLIGQSRALEMMLLGEPVSSEKAMAYGLVNEVHSSQELLTKALSMAERLANRSALALSTIKRLVKEGIELPLASALKVESAALPRILGSHDYAEGLKAFSEKRTPQFSDPAE